MTEKYVPSFKIDKILDRSTFVIVGNGTGDLLAQQKLVILGNAGSGPGGAPLLIPKARVHVDMATKSYAVVRTPLKTMKETRGGAALLGIAAIMGQPREVTYEIREDLAVNEKDMSGNPGGAPVCIGDLVLIEGQVSDYVNLRTTEIP